MVILNTFIQEPAEANNKVFKRFREHHARKTSREDNLTDVFRRTSICSDPILLRYVFKLKRNLRQHKPHSKIVLDMLKPTDQYQLK